MKTIAEARAEFEAIERSWFERYKSKVEAALAKRLPSDYKFKIEIASWQDEDSLRYDIYVDEAVEDEVWMIVIEIEQNFKEEFPEISCIVRHNKD